MLVHRDQVPRPGHPAAPCGPEEAGHHAAGYRHRHHLIRRLCFSPGVREGGQAVSARPLLLVVF